MVLRTVSHIASFINLGAIFHWNERTQRLVPSSIASCKRESFEPMLPLFGLQLGQFQLALSHNLPLNLHFLNDTASYLFCLLTINVSYWSMAIKIVYGTQSHHRSATNRRRKLTKTLFIVTVVSLLVTFLHHGELFWSGGDDSSDRDDYLKTSLNK